LTGMAVINSYTLRKAGRAKIVGPLSAEVSRC